MIKKVFGKIAALGVVAVVVFTAMGYGTYRSMLPEDLFSAGGERAEEPSEKGAVQGDGEETDSGAEKRAE